MKNGNKCWYKTYQNYEKRQAWRLTMPKQWNERNYWVDDSIKEQCSFYGLWTITWKKGWAPLKTTQLSVTQPSGTIFLSCLFDNQHTRVKIKKFSFPNSSWISTLPSRKGARSNLEMCMYHETNFPWHVQVHRTPYSNLVWSRLKKYQWHRHRNQFQCPSEHDEWSNDSRRIVWLLQNKSDRITSGRL